MVSFEIFVKAMPPSLLELKVLPSFCFSFKIPDDVTASIKEVPCFVISVRKNTAFLLLNIKVWIDFLGADMKKKETSKQGTSLFS